MIKVKTSGSKSWVTFIYTPDEATSGVALSGEWNDWAEEPMKKRKNGEYSITKVLKKGSVFQFGYKVNGTQWVAEDECHKVPSPFLSENSLLEL